MARTIHLGWLLGTVLGLGLSAEAVRAEPDPECGQQIRARNVLVLDLEHLRRHPEIAQEFVVERAGKFRLLTSEIEEIRTRTRPSRDPDSVIRRAQKLGAKHGCDLVLLLKIGPYFGRQRGPRARIKDHGYAFVVMGERIEHARRTSN
jgi:hypothetical protein